MLADRRLAAHLLRSSALISLSAHFLFLSSTLSFPYPSGTAHHEEALPEQPRVEVVLLKEAL